MFVFSHLGCCYGYNVTDKTIEKNIKEQINTFEKCYVSGLLGYNCLLEAAFNKKPRQKPWHKYNGSDGR